MKQQNPRILVAECMQEISSFNPLQSGYDNFHIEHGSAMLAQEGLNTGLGGALAVFREKELEPVLAISARAGSAGLLSAPGWKRLCAEVLESVARQAVTGVEVVVPRLKRVERRYFLHALGDQDAVFLVGHGDSCQGDGVWYAGGAGCGQGHRRSEIRWVRRHFIAIAPAHAGLAGEHGACEHGR